MIQSIIKSIYQSRGTAVFPVMMGLFEQHRRVEGGKVPWYFQWQCIESIKNTL